MKKKIVQTKKNTWKLKNKWGMEEWVTLTIFVLIFVLALVQVLRSGMFKTKKEMYNESLFDKRTYININNIELDIMKEIDRGGKVYYYLRNGLLHVRYSVTRFIKMSDTELKELRERLSKSNDKQQEMLSEWKFQTSNLGKEVKDVQRQKTWEHIQSHEKEMLQS